MLYTAFRDKKKSKHDMQPLDFFKPKQESGLTEGQQILANVKAYNENLRLSQEKKKLIKTKQKINDN